MSQSLRISDLHEIGKSMSEQLTGREDRPATGQDLYNFALKVDANFTLLKNDMATGFAINSQEFSNVRTEMLSEFKAVRAEIHKDMSGFKSSMIAWLASFGITIISVTSGLGVAILLKM